MDDTKCQLDNKTFKDIVCWNKQCNCQPGQHYAIRRNACVHTAGIGEQCSIDENCEKLMFAECYENKCVCKPNYFASGGKCKIGLNADCIFPDQCSAVKHAKCTKGKCKCEDNFVERSVELCVPVTPYGGECQYVEQCTSQTSNATCEATKDGAKVCGCGTGQHHHASGCFQTKTLDERCDLTSECFVTSKYDSIACVGNKCVCVEGFKKVNGTFCGSAGSILSSAVLVFFMMVVKSVI
ncbi:uncharacterized protein LOC141533939 [Cotesia typhae]